MDFSRGGECCITRNNNANGGGGYAYDTSKVNRILLRYRPIAPKPASSGGSTFNKLAESSAEKRGRGKRKSMQKERKPSKRASRRRKVPGNNNQSPPVVTLQLLPESPENKYSQASKYSSDEGPSNSPSNGFTRSLITKTSPQGSPNWLSLEKHEMMRRVVISSWVKVESVAYTWLADPYWLRSTDNEKVMRLDQDTCPGFISGGGNRVSWVNRAYKEVFGGGGGSEEVVVWLVLGDEVELRGMDCGGFTCKVRVVTCGEGLGKKSSSFTLPCDVWRMDFGGFAWRLDTKAALSLSR
ncbi:hypothetical protein LIER_23870 [Lithospermum erythrorhizon]|uniref:DUF7950 domain-containing protein n=1 Tax=Lithospermum erythrorhizon TaxID=34254 RepID=A0AAV3R4Q6_LITER